jgi:hypothetical protein
MNNKWLIVINPVIGVLIVMQAITGLNMVFGFLDRRTFVALHAYGGYLLFFLVLCHLAINWFWVRNVLVKKKKDASPSRKEL